MGNWDCVMGEIYNLFLSSAQAWERDLPMRAPWVACRYSLHGQDRATPSTPCFNGFNRVLTARWQVTTIGSKPRADRHLVRFYKPDKEPSHHNNS